MSENFPGVNFASSGSVVLERIEDTPDIVRAREIENNYRQRKEEGSGIGFRTVEEQTWIEEQQEKMLQNSEFQQVMTTLRIITEPSPDRAPRELALPSNTIVVDNHPVIAELFDPISQNTPTLKVGEVQRLVEEKSEQGVLDSKTTKRINNWTERYTVNVQGFTKI